MHVTQLQQTKYDTHSNQGPRLKTLLSDLKTGVYTFVKAAENCGFWDDVLVASFTDFGRRLEENSRAGTVGATATCRSDSLRSDGTRVSVVATVPMASGTSLRTD